MIWSRLGIYWPWKGFWPFFLTTFWILQNCQPSPSKISDWCSHEWCALMLIKLNCFCMYAAASENVPRYYVLFVRVAIKQQAAQLRVFHHNFDTQCLLSTKTYWGRNWTIHVSTMYTNLGSFCSISPSWYCPCFDFGSELTIDQFETFFC